MRKICLRHLSLLLLGCAAFDNAAAFGLGVDLGGSAETWNYASTDREVRPAAHLGLVMDTHVTDASLINYRLTFGREISQPRGNGLTLVGYALTHSLGFHLAHGELYRFWLGPQWRLSLYDGLSDDTGNDYKGRVIGTGIGAVAGFNFHPGTALSVGVSGGVHLTGYALDYKATNNGYRGDDQSRTQSGGGFLNLSVLFLMGERGK